ncbi:MAG: hypothetical protein WA847_02530, partial [Terriglobales bacterium]
FRKMFQLREVADWGDPSQLKSCFVSCLLYEIRDFADLIQLVCAARARTPAPIFYRTGARPPAGLMNKGSEKTPQVMRELDRECRFE